MTEPITQNRTQMLAAKRWMEDEAGMERASLSPAEYLVYRMKISLSDAQKLVDDLNELGKKHPYSNGTRIELSLTRSLLSWLFPSKESD